MTYETLTQSMPMIESMLKTAIAVAVAVCIVIGCAALSSEGGMK
jgi:hypothetical protein